MCVYFWQLIEFVLLADMIKSDELKTNQKISIVIAVDDKNMSAYIRGCLSVRLSFGPNQ